MKDFGFDKAADQINLGQIDKTLQGGAQAATYVGSAILAVNTIIKSLESCPATSTQDIQTLQTARNNLRGDELRKELNARRLASNSKRQRQDQIQTQSQKTQNQCTQVTNTANKCVTTTAQKPTVSEQIRNVTGGIIDLGRVLPS
jgi:hypothetical protein